MDTDSDRKLRGQDGTATPPRAMATPSCSKPTYSWRCGSDPSGSARFAWCSTAPGKKNSARHERATVETRQIEALGRTFVLSFV
mmetsp:Transcript_68809/g.108600  ORF Transcript_68809/g.108600 Transcript_68809/m.108600 type:complete len:84 (-) Transcript_68809:2867-3118(-)